MNLIHVGLNNMTWSIQVQNYTFWLEFKFLWFAKVTGLGGIDMIASAALFCRSIFKQEVSERIVGLIIWYSNCAEYIDSSRLSTNTATRLSTHIATRLSTYITTRLSTHITTNLSTYIALDSEAYTNHT